MIGLTVKRSTPSRKFLCVPAKRHRRVSINAMNAVTVGNRLFKSNMVDWVYALV
jgi:hypothetical protein